MATPAKLWLVSLSRSVQLDGQLLIQLAQQHFLHSRMMNFDVFLKFVWDVIEVSQTRTGAAHEQIILVFLFQV